MISLTTERDHDLLNKEDNVILQLTLTFLAVWLTSLTYEVFFGPSWKPAL